MKKQAYTTKTGKTQYRPVVSTKKMESIVYGDSSLGWCLHCGKVVKGVEPDATKYTHRNGCGLDKVYGLETLLTLGLVVIK